MRHPQPSRNVSLLVCVAGVGLVAWIAPTVDHKHETWWQVVSICIGVSCAFFGFCYAVFAQVEFMRLTRLLRGGETLAAWTVESQLWRDFLELNRQLNQRDPDWTCIFDRHTESQIGPIRVHIGKASLMLGEDFFSLPKGGFTTTLSARRIEGSPSYLEFHLRTEGGETTSAFTRTLRVPVPRGSEQAADTVVQHYHDRVPPMPPPISPSRLKLGRNIALAIAILSALAFAGAMMFGRELKGNGQIVVLVSAIGGALLCPGALIVAAVWHVRSRTS